MIMSSKVSKNLSVTNDIWVTAGLGYQVLQIQSLKFDSKYDIFTLLSIASECKGFQHLLLRSIVENSFFELTLYSEIRNALTILR